MVAYWYREFVRERLAGLDRRLRYERDSIHCIRQLESVKVHCGGFAELIVQNESYAIALADTNLRSWHLIVVRPGFDFLTGSGFPLHLRRSELEYLYAADDSRSEKLVSLPLSLCGKCLDPRLVHC